MALREFIQEAYSYGYDWGETGPPAEQLNGLVGACNLLLFHAVRIACQVVTVRRLRSRISDSIRSFCLVKNTLCNKALRPYATLQHPEHACPGMQTTLHHMSTPIECDYRAKDGTSGHTTHSRTCTRSASPGDNMWPSEGETGLGSAWKTPLLQLFDRKVAISRALTSAMALALGKQACFESAISVLST